jgi:small-conductance mechanosensitive channel
MLELKNMDNAYLSLLISAGVIIALAAIGLIAVHFLKKRLGRAINSIYNLPTSRRQQLQTILQIALWSANVIIVTAALLMLLSTFGIDITPLIASAGIAGLALSLGAQTLVKDLIGGILILVENQYAVGDSIQVGDVIGQVERLTLRVTYVRGVNGYLNTIPNGDLRTFANLTKDWSRALVDVGVASEEDPERVLQILDEIGAAFAQDETFGPLLLEPPQAIGPISLGDWTINMRIMVKTLPGKHLEVVRELQKRILVTFDREGITMPYPRQEIFIHHQGSDDP